MTIDIINRRKAPFDWWCVTPMSNVQVTTAAANKALPDVVVPAWLPMPFKSVVAMMMFRRIVNSNVAANSTNAIQYIQVQRVGGAYTNAITIPDIFLATNAATTEGGPVWIGATDIKAQVNAPGITCNFQWTSADANLDDFTIWEIYTGLRFEF